MLSCRAAGSVISTKRRCNDRYGDNTEVTAGTVVCRIGVSLRSVGDLLLSSMEFQAGLIGSEAGGIANSYYGSE